MAKTYEVKLTVALTDEQVADLRRWRNNLQDSATAAVMQAKVVEAILDMVDGVMLDPETQRMGAGDMLGLLEDCEHNGLIVASWLTVRAYLAQAQLPIANILAILEFITGMHDKGLLLIERRSLVRRNIAVWLAMQGRRS